MTDHDPRDRDPEQDLDAAFGALAHPTRRGMLARLAGQQLSVGELAAPLPVSLAAASKHVQVLERAGLIERTVVGRRHEFRLRPAMLAAARRWLDDQLPVGPGGSATAADPTGPARPDQPKRPKTSKTSKAPKTHKTKDAKTKKGKKGKRRS